MGRMRVVSIFVLVLCSASVPVTAAPRRQPPPPGLHCVPWAVAPGTTTDVTFFAPAPSERFGLWTSFPAEVTPLHQDPKTITVRFTVPPKVPIGIGALRLLTAGGLSGVQLFMIDDLPSVESTGRNHAPHDAQPLSGAIAVDGSCEPLASDYFMITAARGQKMSVEVVAQRLGSLMDPLIRLLDSSGRELVYCDDSPGAGADCRFRYTFPADGDYLLELRDAEYGGGPDYRYRLRVGDFPLIESVFPPGARRGASARFEVVDSGGERLDPINVTIPTTTPRTFVNARYPQGKGSGFAAVRCEQVDEFVARGPNHTAEDAARVELPVVIGGRLDRKGAQDFYRFHARKGDRISLAGQTRSLGSPCDLFLRVSAPDGQKAAESPESAAGEPSLEFSAKQDGDYLLSVEDINRGGGAGMVYRVEIQPGARHFELTTDSEKVQAVPGKSFKINVKCVRHDYAGPISLSLTGDAAAWELSSSTIADAKTQTDLEVKVPDDAVTGKPFNFSIVARADVSGHQESTVVSTAPALIKLFPRLPYPPLELDGQIGVAIDAPAKKTDE